ncbi:helix-turn-helix domain-containing protein [Brevibacillus borstelensis]|uniref:helix-turn-helix domain-containing protein n=1 Tax=Brevibacillus borstelensis TaxID=45462 RepID=UPI0030C36EDD
MSSPSLIEREWAFIRSLTVTGMLPLAGERTVQALYYILRGRKANQTLQDVHLYSLYPYYRMFPRLLKEEWEKIVYKLQEDQLLIPIPAAQNARKPSFFLTEKARQIAAEGEREYTFSYWFEPFSQADVAEQVESFWLRLHLVVQTVSHLLERDLSFQPIVQEKRTQRWVKERLAEKAQRARWTEGLAKELFHSLTGLPEPVQEMIFRRFSGVSQSGLTLAQLSLLNREAPSYIHVQFRSGLARMIRAIQEKRADFPLLSTLLENEGDKDPRLTESASLTYVLAKRGYSIDQIAKRRNIKPSTVEDHLVEIALRCPEWDSSRYLSADLAEKIVEVSNRLETSRLRLVKDQLGAGVSYLQIRLALARKKGGEEHAKGDA